MNKTGVIIPILFLFLSVHIPARAQLALADRYISHTLSMEDGLPSNFIDDICRDKAGFLWLATSGGGLSRYDGYSFLTFSTASDTPIQSNFVRNICEDRFHRLWIASNTGVDILDLLTMKTVRLSELEGIRNGLVSCLELDAAGNIWFKSGSTLHRIAFREDGQVAGILSLENEGLSPNELIFKDIDQDGAVWLGLRGHLFRVDVNAQGVLEASPRYPDLDLGENTYLSDFLPAGQELWISTENGLFRLHRTTGEWKQYVHDPADAESLTQNFITSLAQTEDGVVVATSLFGSNVYNPITDSFSRVGDQIVNCTAVYGDKLIVGTETAGLLILEPKELSVKNFQHDASDRGSLAGGPVNAIYEGTDGTLWVGTVEGGISIREHGAKTFSHLTREKDGLAHNSVSVLSDGPDGTLLSGTWGGGISILSTRKPYKVTGSIGRDDDRIQFIGALEYDRRNGLVWIGSNQGIFLFDPGRGRVEPALDTQPSGCIGSCLDSAGRLWIGCREGLYIFDTTHPGADGRFPAVQYRDKLDAPQAHSGEMICCILEATDGTIYLGSNGNGLYKAIPHKDGTFSFTGYSTRDGLSNDRVRGLAEDASGHIWADTDFGLNRLDPDTGEISPFYRQDGLPGNQFYWNSALRGRDGTLYFGALEGLCAVDPAEVRPENEAAPMRLTHFRVGETDIHNPFLEQLQLHERDRSILIEFSAMTIDARKISYEYQMEGYDNGWIRLLPGRHDVSYSRLPHGRYRFFVRAVTPDGKAVNGTSIPVLVKPYFYRTWWFKLLSAALAIGLLWTFYTWRMRTMTRQRDRLQRTVDERTREISQQKKLVEAKAEELARQNKVLLHQNEELVSSKILFSPQRRSEDQSRDDQFVSKALDVIRERYKDPELDVPAFCSAMGMSKTLLNKRLQETVGQSIGQFIRTYRLSVARETLLSNRDMNISEVAYEVGFNDPKYFTRCFTRQFGLAPSSLSKP